MKTNLRSNQDCLIIYNERVEASWFAIVMTATWIGFGVLFFCIGTYAFLNGDRNNRMISSLMVFGGPFLGRGLAMATQLPSFLAHLKKDDGLIVLIISQNGLGIAPPLNSIGATLFLGVANYSWSNIEKILLTRKTSTAEGHSGWDLMIIYLRDDPERKNKSLLERDIWRKKKEKIYLPGLSNEQMDLVRADLSRLSCQNAKILYDKSSA